MVDQKVLIRMPLSELTSVADAGCLSRISDIGGSKGHRIPDPNPQHRIEVFLTQRLLQSCRKYEKTSRISDLGTEPALNSSRICRSQKAFDPGSATLELTYTHVESQASSKIKSNDIWMATHQCCGSGSGSTGSTCVGPPGSWSNSQRYPDPDPDPSIVMQK